MISVTEVIVNDKIRLSTFENAMSIGERIKKVRSDARLTQKAFGQQLGISASYLSEVESGKGKPSKSLTMFISLKYSVNMKWLTSGIGDPYIKEGGKPEPPDEPKPLPLPGPPRININILEEIIEIVDERRPDWTPRAKARLIAEQYIKHHIEPPDIEGDIVRAIQKKKATQE